MALVSRIAYLGLAAALHCGGSVAQEYPSKPIRYIVPYTNGGFADTFARAIGQHFHQKMGQPVIIENRPAAGQMVGLEMAAKAPPDGYTITYGTQSGLVLLTATRKSLPYDPVKDFAPIGTMFSAFFYLVVNPSLPVKSVQELIAYARANPGKLSFGSNGVGSGQHLAMELFRTRTGIDMVHVPYKGSAFSMTGIIAGETQLMMEGAGMVPHMKSGKVRGLAAFTTERSPSMPDLPTLIEAGVPGETMSTWLGLAAPAATPRPIIDRLHREAMDWLKLPATRDGLVSRSLSLTPSTPEEMGARVRREIPMWTKIIRDAGIEQE